jgi:hypothetical protein
MANLQEAFLTALKRGEQLMGIMAVMSALAMIDTHARMDLG